MKQILPAQAIAARRSATASRLRSFRRPQQSADRQSSEIADYTKIVLRYDRLSKNSASIYNTEDVRWRGTSCYSDDGVDSRR